MLFFTAALVAALAVSWGAAQPTRAGELDKLDTSLKWVPADAAYYSSMLRNGEQIEAIAKSRAWAKLTALPAVKMLRQLAQTQLNENPQLAQLLQLYQQPENQQLGELLGDMLSHEIFCYGGSNFTGFTDLVMQIVGAMRYRPALMRLTRQAEDFDPFQVQIITLLHVFSQNLDLIKVPDLVIGFKLSKVERAEAQLKRLEAMLNALGDQMPQLKSRLKRAKIGGGDFLTLTLDGSLVPWQRIPFKDYEQQPGEFDALVKKLTDLKLTIALGVRGQYLMLSLGEGTAGLAQLGTGKRLIDQPELAPLARYTDKRLTSISYASGALRSAAGTTKKDIDNLVETAKSYLPLINLSDEQQKRIRADLAELAKDIKTFIPELGATFSFSFWTERGSESYSYDWGDHQHVAGTMPLTLLNHLGGSPLLAVVGRAGYSPENYQLLVKWLKTAHRYFEEIAIPMLDADQKEKYEQVAKILMPLLARLDKATGQMLLPSLADGQMAFVLDGKMKSQQWIQYLPPSDKPLPMVEPAFVLGVSDAAMLRKAFNEYRSIVNDLMAKLHELSQEIPHFQIPEPETRTVKSGTLYYYPLPESLGLDKQVLPNAGLSDRVAVLAISQEHSERLLTRTPLKTAGGPLADLNQPRSGAVYCSYEGLIDLMLPWVHMGIQAAVQSQQGEGNEKVEGPNWIEILKQVPTALEVLKVFRSYSSSTYLEGKALVTHSETIIRDL
jgi:hypothetical protein